MLLPALTRSSPVSLATCIARRLVHTGQYPTPTHVGTTTPTPPPESTASRVIKAPFYFDTGYALFAKRPSRPFPPPFLSPPSGSFSDPLSTYNRSRDRRSYYNGEMIRGITNGDDAVLVEENFIVANDGVGAWATRDRGHAALWSRLILHFWALETNSAMASTSGSLDPKSYLQKAFESTKAATSEPNLWHGTTTASAALLHHNDTSPLLYVTHLGDSQIMVIRPSTSSVLYKTTEQWHWFDCPLQLGTNSPDTPLTNAVCDTIPLQESDIVLAMTDGLSDNLWEHEIVASVLRSLKDLEAEKDERTPGSRAAETGGGMMWVAQELVRDARIIAEDPFAESPFMERAVEEGIGFEGGKDDPE